MTRVRGPWEATPAGQAISLAMASIRLLVADAYRLGQNFGQEDLSVPFLPKPFTCHQLASRVRAA